MILTTPHYHNLYKNIFLINFLDPNFTKDYQSFLSNVNLFYTKKGFTWRLSDCEELVAPTEEASRHKSGTI